MAENQNPNSSNSKLTSEIESNINNSKGSSFSGQKPHYPNPPDVSNPDPATLRDQWRFAIRQYSRWYSQAWGTAILAGISFFALGWIIKGSNPLPSRQDSDAHSSSSAASDAKEEDRR